MPLACPGQRDEWLLHLAGELRIYLQSKAGRLHPFISLPVHLCHQVTLLGVHLPGLQARGKLAG